MSAAGPSGHVALTAQQRTCISRGVCISPLVCGAPLHSEVSHRRLFQKIVWEACRRAEPAARQALCERGHKEANSPSDSPECHTAGATGASPLGTAQ